jgi:hypothetical protein
MSEQTPAPTPPAGEGATPLAGTPQTPEAPAATPEATPEQLAPELQALIDTAARKASQEANREAKALRERLKAFEEADAKRKEAEMTELEIAQKRATEAVEAANAAAAQLKDERLRAAVINEAAKQGVADPMDAYQLLDKAALVTDSGDVGDVAAAIKQLVDAKPYLKALGPTTNPTNPGGHTPAPTLSDAEKYELMNQGGAKQWWQVEGYAGPGIVTDGGREFTPYQQ